MNTWGISGPDFLLLYVMLLALTWMIVLAMRWRIGAATGAAAAPDQPELDLYEAAMLNGGGRLVLAVAACRLKEAGSFRRDSDDDTLTVTGPRPVNADPVQKWLYDYVKHEAIDAVDLLDEGPADPVLAPIRDRLSERGLMLTDRQTASMLRQVLWFAPLLALGVARLVAGILNHHPVVYLVWLMLLSLGIAVNLCRLPGSRPDAAQMRRKFARRSARPSRNPVLSSSAKRAARDGVRLRPTPPTMTRGRGRWGGNPGAPAPGAVPSARAGAWTGKLEQSSKW